MAMTLRWLDLLASQGSSTALLVLALALALVVALTAFRSKTSSSAISRARALPSRIPVFGNLIELLQNASERHDWTAAHCEKFLGDPFCLEIPGKPTDTFIYTPQGVEDVLKTHFESMPKGARQRDIFRDLLGNGIFAVDGAKWVHQRKTASNLFTANKLREMMTHHVWRYTLVLEGILAKARAAGKPVDLFKLLNKFTIEAFAKMGFGIEMNSLSMDEPHPFEAAFDSAQRMMIFRFLLPEWVWKLERLLNIGTERQLKKDISVIDESVMNIIAQSLKHRQDGRFGEEVFDRSDIVSLFLDRVDMTAGEEALSWCFYNLCSHPEVVAKIREEIARVIPDFAADQNTNPPTMEALQQLTYLDATLKESLRLYPSVPAIPKAVDKDTVLSDGTFLLAGSTVTIPTYAMGRMEFIWGSDAKKFKPERWIDEETGRIKNVSAFKSITFNAGPRTCLGMTLATLEMKIVIASIVSRFNLELCPGQKITYENSLTLPMKTGMLVSLS